MGPLFLNFWPIRSVKPKALFHLGPNSDMSSNDMSCDNVSLIGRHVIMFDKMTRVI